MNFIENSQNLVRSFAKKAGFDICAFVSSKKDGNYCFKLLDRYIQLLLTKRYKDTLDAFDFLTKPKESPSVYYIKYLKKSDNPKEQDTIAKCDKILIQLTNSLKYSLVCLKGLISNMRIIHQVSGSVTIEHTYMQFLKFVTRQDENVKMTINKQKFPSIESEIGIKVKLIVNFYEKDMIPCITNYMETYESKNYTLTELSREMSIQENIETIKQHQSNFTKEYHNFLNMRKNFNNISEWFLIKPQN
ncbi:hypothetical protein A3Q56_01995 [Intoshia linei]|uniref:Uncharacterized protein n=1 Tax=Intoshia linei TaxID=1819745 RepID=A0A177B983_9BILA|nr:hypothetical protein A3Q56_01995 [Intoshia linei]